jgi:hypothetical protein
MVIVSALLSLADNVLALDTVAVFGILAPNSLGRVITLTFPLGLRVRRLGGKPARAEAAGDAAAKKRACKLFLPPCVPTACARGLVTGRRPRA